MSSAVNRAINIWLGGGFLETARLRAAAFVLCLSVSGIAWGQSTFGEFVGTVHDPTGSVVPNCVVKAVNLGTSATRSTLTDASGDYTLVNMEPGDYEISLSAPGFEVTKFSGMTLMARQTIRQDANLALARQGQTVNVSVAAEAPINTEVSNIAETKVGRELTDLPVAIYSRASGSTSAITTLTTQPGVETDASGNLSVAGAKPAMLTSSLDGISTISPKGAAPISELFPSFDTHRRDSRQRGQQLGGVRRHQRYHDYFEKRD